jgi:hypothetical protein
MPTNPTLAEIEALAKKREGVEIDACEGECESELCPEKMKRHIAFLLSLMRSRDARLAEIAEEAYREGWNDACLGSWRQPTLAWDHSKTKHAIATKEAS